MTTDQKNVLVTCALVGVLFVVGVNSCLSWLPTDEEVAAQRAREQLIGHVRVNATHVYIHNDSDVMWENCLVTMNDRWSRNTRIVLDHDHMPLELRGFTDSAGLRFDPSTHKVHSVSVLASTPDGYASLNVRTAS